MSIKSSKKKDSSLNSSLESYSDASISEESNTDNNNENKIEGNVDVINENETSINITEINEKIKSYNNNKKETINTIEDLLYLDKHHAIKKTMWKSMRGLEFLNKIKTITKTISKSMVNDENQGIHLRNMFHFDNIFSLLNDDELDVLKDILEKYHKYFDRRGKGPSRDYGKFTITDDLLGDWNKRGKTKDVIVYLYDKIRLLPILQTKIHQKIIQYLITDDNNSNFDQIFILENIILFFFSEIRNIINITRDENGKILDYEINIIDSVPASDIYLKYIDNYIDHVYVSINLKYKPRNEYKTIDKKELFELLLIEPMTTYIDKDNNKTVPDIELLRSVDLFRKLRKEFLPLQSAHTRITQRFSNLGRKTKNFIRDPYNATKRAFNIKSGGRKTQKNKKTRKHKKYRK